MAEIKRISSSRTNLFKIVSIVLPFVVIYSSFKLHLFTNGFKDIFVLIFSIFLIALSLLSIFLGLKITTMTVENDLVLFTNLFKREKNTVNLHEIKPYLIRTISLSLFDPFSLNKFSIISYKDQQGKHIEFLVLTPSSFSVNSDIPKYIKLLQQDPKEIPSP